MKPSQSDVTEPYSVCDVIETQTQWAGNLGDKIKQGVIRLVLSVHRSDYVIPFHFTCFKCNVSVKGIFF